MQKILDNFWCQTNIYSKKKKPTDFWYLIKSISEYQMFTFFFIYQKKFPDIRKKTFFDKVELKIFKNSNSWHQKIINIFCYQKIDLLIMISEK